MVESDQAKVLSSVGSNMYFIDIVKVCSNYVHAPSVITDPTVSLHFYENCLNILTVKAGHKILPLPPT